MSSFNPTSGPGLTNSEAMSEKPASNKGKIALPVLVTAVAIAVIAMGALGLVAVAMGALALVGNPVALTILPVAWAAYTAIGVGAAGMIAGPTWLMSLILGKCAKPQPQPQLQATELQGHTEGGGMDLIQ